MAGYIGFPGGSADTTALEAAIAANSTAAANAQDNLLLNANGKKPICQRADAGMFTLGSTTLAAGACSFDLWRVLGSDYIPDVIDNAFYFAMSSSDGYVLQSVSDYAPLAGKTLSYSVKIDMANAGTLTVNDNLVELVNVPLAAGVNIISGTFTMSSSPDGLNFAVYSPTAGYVKIHYASLVEGSIPAGEILPRHNEPALCMEYGHLITTQSGGIVQTSGTSVAMQVRHLVRMRRVPDISFVAPAVIGNGYSWEATQSAVGYSTPSGIPYLSEDSTHLYLDNFTGLTVNDSVWLLNGHLWLDAGIN